MLQGRSAIFFFAVRNNLHCKKHHFVPNRYIYVNQSNIEEIQDIYLLQSEFVVVKHNLLLFQIVPITLNDIICFK